MHKSHTKILALLTLATFVLSANVNAKGRLYTEIEKITQSNWTVSYQSNKPIKAVMFASSPDKSRLQRWQPLSSEFRFNYLNGKEIITRKDGNSFTSIKIKLTPSYIHLPKSYAPFSPFSNGAMLVHSARFFACPNICSGGENLWAIAVRVPAKDSIIVDGTSYKNKTSWWDKNDGQKIYIGRQVSHQNGSYISIIDPKLISNIGKQLQKFFPSMMSFLEKRYGALPSKPMLFASFGKTDEGSSGHQGGTLPNQVFMHWYGDDAYHEENIEATLWFFAHEAAHLYQKMSGKATTPVDNWLHEGHAEMMAKKIMLSLLPQYQSFVEGKVAQAKDNCLEIMKKSSLPEQIEAGNYQALYDCGLNIFNTIENESLRINVTDALWVELMKQAKAGTNIHSNALLSLAENKYGLTKSSADKFRKLVGLD
jgi:hypothetical protein